MYSTQNCKYYCITTGCAIQIIRSSLRICFLGSTTNSVSHLVTIEVPLASLNIAPIDIDEIAPLPSRQSVVVSSTLDTSSIPSVTVTTPLSASRLRLLQDTTMIESALDLDSWEDNWKI